MQKAGLVLLGLLAIPIAASHADPVRDAALKTVDCKDLVVPEERLACFDRSVTALSDALATAPMSRAGETMAQFESPANGDSGAAAPATTATQTAALAGGVQDAAPGAGSISPAVKPSWAAAPEPRATPDEQAEEPTMFTAKIVRITRNGVGRYKFYTDDGAVWEQTQIVEIRPPRSLPAEAEIRQRLTGSPTIKFDVSNQAYRVRRIE